MLILNANRHPVSSVRRAPVCWAGGREFKPRAENQPRSLTLSPPECLMELCKVTLTFESVDEILRCDHSNESSLPVLKHSSIYFSKFHRMKFQNLVGICFWLNLAVKGLKKIGEIMLAEKPLSQFRWSRHWAVTLSLHPCISVGRGRKRTRDIVRKE